MFIFIFLFLFCIVLLIFLDYHQNTVNKKLTKRILHLEKENNELQNILVQSNNANNVFTRKEADISSNSTSLDDKIEAEIFSTPCDYYSLKFSCMNYDEASVFYYITHALDKIITNPIEREKYFVFPQYALHSIIQINPKLNPKSKSHEIATRNFVAKSIDFIICYHTSNRNNKTNYIDHSYLPVFAFELDGPSHYSSNTYGEEAFERTKKGDKIKTVIFESQSIPLIRYTPIYVDIKLNPNKYSYPQNQQPRRIFNDDYVNIKTMIQAILTVND